MMKDILKKYGIEETNYFAEALASGLINKTWKISAGDKQFILQRINNTIFTHPNTIAENIRMIDTYLEQHTPGYVFASPVKTITNQDVVYDEAEGCYRLFLYIKNSHTIEVVTTPGQAFEAAFQFGKFTKILSHFDASKLHKTIDNFHNLSLRYQQFEDALKLGNRNRIIQSEELIAEIRNHENIVQVYEKLKNNPLVKKRVTHHDTKISNVLFDNNDKGICVIDLDTVMPGYFISDLGDMMRTYLSPVNEEEKDFSKIEVREDFFRSIISGYLSAMGDELTTEEKALIFYAGLFLTYMQALRFLTDHLNDDIYYGARYEDHNLVRAGNQVQLLKKLQEKKEVLQKIITDELQKGKHLSVLINVFEYFLFI